MISSPNFYFNVTNFLRVENIIFTGVNAEAVYNGSMPNLRMQEFPYVFCNVTTPFPTGVLDVLTFNKATLASTA